MGGGDVKLMGGVGALIGWQGVITTVIFASFIGLVYSVFLMIFKGKKGGDAIPFGPFLSMGALINLFVLVKFTDLSSGADWLIQKLLSM